MSIWTIGRQRLILRARCFSSAGNAVRAQTPNPVNLSPEKMRALIAMYHQAETFVTRENLDDKIAEAFTGGNGDENRLFGVGDRSSISLDELQSALRSRQDAPTVTEWSQTQSGPLKDVAKYADANMEWSGRRYNERERRVVDALYGVETQKGKALPGWDALNENGPLIETSRMEDEENKYEDSDY
ncbi:hypothetical protein K438DRAFT_38320 [Mycena galopus ATCC 62051]|nr:hypothetical protein K438DRAFT_38320 [Mycena galopus ATCC 62051]